MTKKWTINPNKEYRTRCPICNKPLYTGDDVWVDDSCDSQCQPCCSVKCYKIWKKKQ